MPERGVRRELRGLQRLELRQGHELRRHELRELQGHELRRHEHRLRVCARGREAEGEALKLAAEAFWADCKFVLEAAKHNDKRSSMLLRLSGLTASLCSRP